MLRLYYTGATTSDQSQPKKEYSLGGYISNTVIPNNQIANIFSAVSKYSIDSDLFEVVGIALKNEGDAKIFDVTIYFDYPADAYCKIEVAPVAPAGSINDGFYVERIANNYSLPYTGEFEDIDGVANAINIGDIEPGKYIVLWMKRTINQYAVKDLTDADKLNEAFIAGTTLPKREDVVLNIFYDDNASV
jgi:hypothetical protein